MKLEISQQKMNKLCRQISIESPGAAIKDCVFSFDIPIPDVPARGVRIRVVCAGACYRSSRRSLSMSSDLSSVSFQSDLCDPPVVGSTSSTTEQPCTISPVHQGLRDGALFPGFEVAGIVDELGADLIANPDCNLKIGDRVIIYPYDDVPNGYADYIVVPDLKYVIRIPDNLSLSVAAILPSGALLAENAVLIAYKNLNKILQEQDQCKILIVGTGGLALWAIRIANHYFQTPDFMSKVLITVATIKDEGFALATQEFNNINIVQWNEDLYEKQLIERTVDACGGLVNIVIDFGTTSRSLHRSLKCLKENGIVLISKETADRLMPKFASYAENRKQIIIPVENGSVEQLEKIVQLVAQKKIEPPPHTVFPAEEAGEVIRKLCNSEIAGRAILKFHDIE